MQEERGNIMKRWILASGMLILWASTVLGAFVAGARLERVSWRRAVTAAASTERKILSTIAEGNDPSKLGEAFFEFGPVCSVTKSSVSYYVGVVDVDRIELRWNGDGHCEILPVPNEK